jgi:hypothetical protein
MRIRDTDPKQGAEYYTRYHFRDITVFDLDEECKPIISLPLSSIISTLHHLPSIRGGGGGHAILLCSYVVSIDYRCLHDQLVLYTLRKLCLICPFKY